MQGRGVWASLGMLLFVLGLWGCPDLGPTCPAPSVLLGGQCYPQCVEGDVNYCARDGSVLFPPDVVEDVRGVVDARDAGEAGFADRESMDVPVDVAPMCPANTPTRCADVCVDTTTSLEHCGRCAMMCPSTANGTATCTMGRCGLACAMGYQSLGGACIADRLVPRQIAPLSLGDVTLRRPTLRWELPAGFDGALVEICRDRACAQVIETINVVGTSTRPLMPLPATTVVFWRLRGRVGAATSATNSPVWLFHVPLRDGTSGVDTSYHAHNDVNGDGFDDVVVGAPRASPGGRSGAGRVSVYHGGLMGLSAMPARELEGVLADDSFGSSVAAAGDLNGDGYGDVVVGANGEDSPRAPPGSVSVFHGSALGLGAMAARVLVGVGPRDHFGDALAGAGDLNGDGYADLVVGAPNADPMGRSNAGTASVFSGSAMGVGANASRVIEGLNADDAFGYSVASAGDLNGDGLGDVVGGRLFGRSRGTDGSGSRQYFCRECCRDSCAAFSHVGWRNFSRFVWQFGCARG